ncbi:MAG: helix-turn-helix domain-containing protein [Gallionellaceae bacterium]
MQTEDSKKLYSPNSAARALDISRSKIYDLMKSGAVRFVLIGSDRRIPSDEIQRIASEGTPSTTQTA